MWIGTGIDVRDLKRAMAGFVAGHLARAERGVGGHHVQAGIVCSTVGGQIENCDMVARGFRCGEGAPRPRMQGDVTYAAQRRRNVIRFTRSCKNSQPSRSYSALTGSPDMIR